MACNSTNNPPAGVDIMEEFAGFEPDAVLRTTPFSKGVNFSAWFETTSAQGIPFTKYVEQDFADVKSMGADVIRLPVRMHSMTSGAPDFTLDPLLLGFLDKAVDWAEKYQLYLLIDNHSFDPIKPLEKSVEGMLISVWKQIANRYKNRSDYVVYEILNEPHGISDKDWGDIQGKAIAAIREIDKNPNRWIIVGGTDYNSIGKLSAIPKYTDEKLIYTFHFYDPFMFTHQGASWCDPSLVPLAGVPFPADSKRMPPTPSALKTTWVDGSLKNYKNDASPKALNATLNKVVSFSKSRDVPVFCGEFGVYMPNSQNPDRVRWYQVITDMLDKRGISRASWDYFGGFGIFNFSGHGDFHSDLNVAVVSAMGFTPPQQTPHPPTPIDKGFTLYDDYPAKEFSSGYWGDETDFSLYETQADEGEYAIRWGNVDRYNVFWFGFERNGDFSYLAANGYRLEFRARTAKPVNFDVRFVNPESATSIPWRIRYAVTETILPPDGKWHTISIPLRDMKEHGAWLNEKQQWINPRGEFSWENVRQLEFVAEESELKDHTIWFDSIKITGK